MKYKTKKDKASGLLRIICIQSFGDVKKGDVGGLIQSCNNLSQYGDAWVFEDARVFGNAKVFEDAGVSGNAWVFGNAMVSGNARVFGNAMVSGNAWVFGDARVFGNARVFGDARVFGNAMVSGNAVVSETIHITQGKYFQDLRENLNPLVLLRQQFHIIPSKNKIYLYKRVNSTIKKDIFNSCYDKDFVYKIGAIAKAQDPEYNMESCAGGLHASTPDYWQEGDALIIVEIYIKDIITIQEGKVRCSKLKVIEEVKDNE